MSPPLFSAEIITRLSVNIGGSDGRTIANLGSFCSVTVYYKRRMPIIVRVKRRQRMRASVETASRAVFLRQAPVLGTFYSFTGIRPFGVQSPDKTCIKPFK